MSRAEWIGVVCLPAALLLSFVDVRLSFIPLGLFLISCAVLPFFPRSSFFLPVISRGSSGKRAVSLTFDDGPDPLSTPELLALLSAHGVKATFFVTGQRALAHPELMREILSQGHTLGNHTYSHDCLFALRSTKRMLQEIESTQNILRGLGIRTLVFRPPVGIASPRLRRIMRQMDAMVIGFSCRAFDRGNRCVGGLAKKILGRVRPDDIILLHDTRSKDHVPGSLWIEEIESLLSGLKTKEFEVLPLSELIGRPVMVMDQGSGQGAVSSEQ
ncbi:MAG: polysaccharide deacetylase family protein [Desulfobacteraceae bacterium]|nr:MAG: polysaccharide deacetylase family protein [Desulfobacteraceae bacterium]